MQSALVWLALYLCAACSVPASARPNVLFIGVDDLRPEISGPYGQDYVHTPGLKKLAGWSTTFTRAHCQIALCSPSRTSLLTGLRPNSAKIWSIGPYFRTTMGARGSRNRTKTLPQWFRINGYNVSGAGKIFHPGFSSGGPSKGEGGGDGGYPFDAEGAWSRPYHFCDQFYNGTLQSPAMQQWPGAVEENAGCIQSPDCVKCLSDAGSLGGKPAWAAAPCPAECYPDGAVAVEVIRQLAEQKKSLDAGGAPFFLACGFKRPHLGWFAPQKYFDMYNASTLQIAKHRTPSQDAPKVAFSGNGEMCGMRGPKNPAKCSTESGFKLLSEQQHAEMRRAYYACVSFMDSQLLRVLDAVEANGLLSNTIIVFWGDHGYQLGEHGEWAKITNWELATRVPFLISMPGVKGGAISDALVEHLDFYPTLIDAAGLPAPVDPATGKPQLEGRSLVGLLRGTEPAKTFNASFSQIQRGGSVQGLTIRSDRWRYTEWVKFDYKAGLPIFEDNNTDIELYDHLDDVENDFDAYENVNAAFDPANAAVVAKHAAALRWMHRPQAAAAVSLV